MHFTFCSPFSAGPILARTLLKSTGLLVVAFSVLCMNGCSGGATGAGNRLPTHQVTGKVTYKGQALDGAHITYHPKDPAAPGAFAKTDSSGNYSLRTYTDGDGAPAGEYTVTIEKSSGPPPVQKSGAEMFKEMEARAEQGLPPESTTPTLLVPVAYTKAETTDLRVKVVEGSGNSYDFDLKD